MKSVLVICYLQPFLRDTINHLAISPDLQKHRTMAPNRMKSAVYADCTFTTQGLKGETEKGWGGKRVDNEPYVPLT